MKKIMIFTILLSSLIANSQTFIYAKLYACPNGYTSTKYLEDGCLILIDNSYFDSLDLNDMRKIINPAENLSINKNGTLLAIERRQTNHTILLNISNLSIFDYELEVVSNIDNYFFEDSKTGFIGRVLNSDTLRYRFNSTSVMPDRFKLIYTQPLSIIFPSPIPIRSNNKPIEEYIIYNIIGQFLKKTKIKPTGALIKINEKSYIKL